MGAQNSDVTPENYEKAMKDAGYDKVLAEYQKQYREFLENKK